MPLSENTLDEMRNTLVEFWHYQGNDLWAETNKVLEKLQEEVAQSGDSDSKGHISAVDGLG